MASQDGDNINFLVQAIIAEDWDYFENKSHSDIRADAKAWSKVPCFVDCRGSSNVLPIHVAAAMITPFHIFDKILRAYPEGIYAKESGFGRLPLHVACRSDASIDVIRVLLWHYPEAAHTPDMMGRLPLHYAIRYSATDDIVKALLSINPLAAQQYDRPGWLPIHMACQGGAPATTVKLLIDAYPASVNATTATGITPMSIMHISRKNCANRRKVMELLQGIEESDDKEEEKNDKSNRAMAYGRRNPPPFEKTKSVPANMMLTPDYRARSSPQMFGKQGTPQCVGDLKTPLWDAKFHENET